MELKKNAHQKFKGKKRNGLKTKAAIMESITSLLKRSLNRAWVYHYSRANLFITNEIRIFSLNEFFLGFHGGSNISSNASIFQTVKLSYHTRVKLSYKYRYLYSQSRSFYNQILFPQSRNPFKKKKTETSKGLNESCCTVSRGGKIKINKWQDCLLIESWNWTWRTILDNNGIICLHLLKPSLF